MELPTVQTAAHLIPQLSGSIVNSTALVIAAFPFIQSIGGRFLDFVARHKIMAITVCSGLPLILAYFRSKAKHFNASGGHSRESMAEDKALDGSERRTSIISGSCGAFYALVFLKNPETGC